MGLPAEDNALDKDGFWRDHGALERTVGHCRPVYFPGIGGCETRLEWQAEAS